MKFQYKPTTLHGDAVLFVLADGDFIGYLQEVSHRGRTNKIGRRWRIYASWTGRAVTGGKLYQTRKEAAVALKGSLNVVASVMSAFHKHFGEVRE